MIVFALGEALQAPRYYEYVSDLAPKEQVGTYMGFAFLPVAIGTFFAGMIAGPLVEHYIGYKTDTGFIAGPGSANPHAMWYWVGLIGIVSTLAMILFARSRGLRVWTMFDVIAAGVPVGLGLVRVANFINSELWGRPTELPWAFEFPTGGPLPRHPSQLYEAALEGVVLFFVLRFLTHSRLKLRSPGFVAGAFVAGYGMSRIFVEFFREPDPQIGYLAGGWLTMGMVLSVPMVLAGVWAMSRSARAPRPGPA